MYDKLLNFSKSSFVQVSIGWYKFGIVKAFDMVPRETVARDHMGRSNTIGSVKSISYHL